MRLSVKICTYTYRTATDNTRYGKVSKSISLIDAAMLL